MNEVKRGRPPTVKKGKPTWSPAAVLDVTNKEDGYRYRWSNKDPENLARKSAEGWETINGLQADKAQHVEPDKIQDGKKMTSVYERKDCILQRLPEDIAEARDEYMNNKTKQRTAGLTAHLKKEIGKEAPIHGKITIGSLKGGEETVES